jgi:hypothetical protein
MMTDEFYAVKQPNLYEKISKVFGLKKFSRKPGMNKELASSDNKECQLDELALAWNLHSLIKPHY